MSLLNKTAVRLSGAALLILGIAACSEKPLDPGKVADPLVLQPQGLNAAITITDTSAVVSLVWSPPAGTTSFSGYYIYRQFEDEGIDLLEMLEGTIDTVSSIDTIVVNQDATVDTIWSINVTMNSSTIARNITDDIYGMFLRLKTDTTKIVHQDPLRATNPRRIILNEGRTYFLRYYVSAWILFDQNFIGTYSDWLALPILEAYTYTGAYSQPFEFQVEVINSSTISINGQQLHLTEMTK